MTGLFLLVLLVGFSVASLAFLLVAQGLTKKSKWLGMAAMVLAAPFFFWLGVLSERSISGQCYSRSVHLIADAIAKTQSPASLAERVRSLPLYGYETVCADVEVAAEHLSNASAP